MKPGVQLVETEPECQKSLQKKSGSHVQDFTVHRWPSSCACNLRYKYKAGEVFLGMEIKLSSDIIRNCSLNEFYLLTLFLSHWTPHRGPKAVYILSSILSAQQSQEICYAECVCQTQGNPASSTAEWECESEFPSC